MVVVTGRTFLAIVMPILRRGCTGMFILATSLGSVGAKSAPARIGTDDAGIQSCQRKKDH